MSRENHIPFVGWHFIPYVALDAAFAWSLFACRNRQQLDYHAARLACAIAICLACFLIWPLKFGFERPAFGGVLGELHQQFLAFDAPYNQAPSLHVVLTLLVAQPFLNTATLLRKCLVWAIGGLVVLSVLTLKQHHAIDIIVALPVVWFCLLCFTDQEHRETACSTKNLKLGLIYFAAGLVLLLIAAQLPVAGLFFLWPILASLLMAIAYLLGKPGLLGKQANGQLSLSATCLLLPMRIVQWLYAWWMRRSVAPVSEIEPGLFIASRMWSKGLGKWVQSRKIHTWIDCATEFAGQPKVVPCYQPCQWLDLSTVPEQELRRAADQLAIAMKQGPVLVQCKLGLQRSALLVMAYWVCHKGMTPDQALKAMQKARPGAVLRLDQIPILRALQSSAATSNI